MANLAQAWADRQNLARDIFGRLWSSYFFRASKGSAPNGIPVFKDVGGVPWLGVGQQNAMINVPQNPTSAILPPAPISVSVGAYPLRSTPP
jgi:hypothetical protein